MRFNQCEKCDLLYTQGTQNEWFQGLVDFEKGMTHYCYVLKARKEITANKNYAFLLMILP